MSQIVPFTKMHGLGNDFVILDDLITPVLPELEARPELTGEFAKRICHRRFGVGADQILWLRKPQNPSLDLRMDILNADGSIAEMCGNGIRAVALYLNGHSPEIKPEYLIETLAGTQIVKVVGKNEVQVDMGPPKLGEGETPSGEMITLSWKGQKKEFRFYEISMGNPHAVIFTHKIAEVPLEEVGPLIEKNPRFPNRTNVEFVEIVSPKQIKVAVWERGAGATLACGTGACAAAVASIATGKVGSPVDVILPGGVLKIEWQKGTSSVFMQGPAQEVFQGKYIFEY